MFITDFYAIDWKVESISFDNKSHTFRRVRREVCRDFKNRPPGFSATVRSSNRSVEPLWFRPHQLVDGGSGGRRRRLQSYRHGTIVEPSATERRSRTRQAASVHLCNECPLLEQPNADTSACIVSYVFFFFFFIDTVGCRPFESVCARSVLHVIDTLSCRGYKDVIIVGRRWVSTVSPSVRRKTPAVRDRQTFFFARYCCCTRIFVVTINVRVKLHTSRR